MHVWLTKSTEERSSNCVSSCIKIAHVYPQKYVSPLLRKKVIALYFQFTFVKVHLSGRSMPRVLVNGEVVRAEVLPRQWAHQDPPQGREGAAGNLSIHFAGSHIIGALTPSTSTYVLVIQMETTSNPRSAWCLRRYVLTTLFAFRKLDCLGRDTRVASTKCEATSSIPLPQNPIAQSYVFIYGR